MLLAPSEKDHRDYIDSPISNDPLDFFTSINDSSNHDDQDIANIYLTDEIPSPTTSIPSPYSKPPPKPTTSYKKARKNAPLSSYFINTKS